MFLVVSAGALNGSFIMLSAGGSCGFSHFIDSLKVSVLIGVYCFGSLQLSSINNWLHNNIIIDYIIYNDKMEAMGTLLFTQSTVR